MDLLAFFRKDSRIISLEDACEHLGVEAGEIFEPASDVKCVHLYREIFFIVELVDGKFWTIVDRSEWVSDTLDEIEKVAYLALNLGFWYSKGFDPTDADGMRDELRAFCINHGYSANNTEKLLSEGLHLPQWHRYYLNDFKERLAKITANDNSDTV